MQRTKATFLTGALVAMAALASGGMAVAPPLEPVRMSSLEANDIAGYPVFDSFGTRVGEVASTQNAQGKTRWLTIALTAGGEAKVASFRAFLDARQQEVDLVLSEDLLIARADGAPRATVDFTQPSA